MTNPQSFNSSVTMASDTQLAHSPPSLPSTKLDLPPPQLFDVLPALHELLSRIDHTPTADSSQLQNPLQSANTSSSSTDTDSGDDIGAHYTDQPPLEPKDLPTEVLAIKAKIRKALREVEKLPDMDWRVEEQEEEIEELRARIERQKAMLKRVGGLGKGSGLG